MYLEVFHEDVCQNRGQGSPIAAPSTCSKKDSPNWKYIYRLQAKFHEGAEVRDGDTGPFLKSHPAAGGVRGPGVPHPLIP